MATYTGLTLWLKDKQTSVGDKLKLSKFAWGSDAVHIPNKHQQLLEFVCGLLVNRKKHNLQNSDTVLVWRTLNIFLQASCHSVIVKPSILQAVVDTLNNVSAPKSKSPSKHKRQEDDVLNAAVSSACLLLKLPSVTTSQFDLLCSVLVAACKHVDSNLDTPKTGLPEDINQLMQAVLPPLIKCQRAHLNQAHVLQVVLDKVLPEAIRASNKCTSQKLLHTFLLNCLLHSDHKESYSIYLRHTFNEPLFVQGKPKQPPKMLITLFTTLADIFKSDGKRNPGEFVPVFLEMFISENKSDPRLCFLMLRRLVEMLLPPSYAAQLDGKGGDSEKGKGERREAEDNQHEDTWWIGPVAACLAECEKQSNVDLFTKPTSNRGNTTQGKDALAWFSSLYQMVLQHNRSAPWFKFLCHLLSLNHLLVEKSWSTVLQDCLSVTKPVSVTEARDQLLQQMISIYVRMRRSSDLLSALMAACLACPGNVCNIYDMPLFYARLCEMFGEVPLTTSLEIWHKVQEAVENFVDKFNVENVKTETCYSKLEWFLGLYTALLSHARLFDHRTAAAFAPQVSRLVTAIEERILVPLRQMKEVKECCPSMSKLLKSWSRLQVMLLPCWGAPQDRTHDEVDDGSQMKLQAWIKRLPGPDKVKFGLQRVRVASPHACPLVLKDVQEETTLTQVFEKLTKLPPLNPELVTSVVDTMKLENTVKDKTVYQYCELCKMLPLLGRTLPLDVLYTCADITVKILIHSSGSGDKLKIRETLKQGEASLESLAKDLLRHPAMRELRPFQARVATSAWMEIFKETASLSSDSPATKKAKLNKNRGTKSCQGGFITWLKKDNLAEDGQHDDDLPKMDLSSLDFRVENKPSHMEMIRILSNLDLEYLPEVNLKCQLGAIVFLTSMVGSDSMLTKQVEKLYIRCLCVPNLSQLLRCFSVEDVLTFAVKYCLKNSSPSNSLLEVTVQAVMNEHSAVVELLPFIKQLSSTLMSDTSLEGCVKFQVLALVMKSCNKYLKKAFHVVEVGQAARDLYSFIAKFVIKFSMDWFSNLKSAAGGGNVNDSPPKTKQGKQTKDQNKIKRKRSGELLHKDEDGDVTLQSEQKEKEGGNIRDAWAGVLSCVTEVLNLWDAEAADDKVNEHLKDVVGKLVEDVTESLRRKAQTLQEQELLFVQGCCYCDLRSRNTADLVEANTKNDLRLLDDDTFIQLWDLCFSNALTYITSQLEDEPEHSHLGQPLSQAGSLSSHKFIGGSYENAFGGCITNKGLDGPRGRAAVGDRSVTDALCALLECCGSDVFPVLLQNLLETLRECDNLDPASIIIAVDVWRKLIASVDLPENDSQLLFKHMYQILSSMLSIVEKFSHLSSTSGVVSDPALAESHGMNKPTSSSHTEASRCIIFALTDFTQLGKSIVTPRMTLLSLHAGLSHDLACPDDIDAVCTLANTLLVRHTNTALTDVPAILDLVNKLLRACMMMGSQDQLTGRPAMLQTLLHSSHLVTRILTLLSSSAYKLELQKVAHVVLAEYVMGLQKHSLHSAVKSELLRGLYKLMDVSDKFRLSALNAALPPGVKDTFKAMHQDYNKYHRYTGVV